MTGCLVLHAQIPDMDAVLQTSDFPCMLRSLPNVAAVSPPVFGYNSHPTYADIPFPDYSYWGHEYSHLLGGWPLPIQQLMPVLPVSWRSGLGAEDSAGCSADC